MGHAARRDTDLMAGCQAWSPRSNITVVWFRRDLRVHDHPALTDAIRHGAPIAPLFVVDPALLSGRFASSNRVWYMLGAVAALADALVARGSRLFIRVGPPGEIVPAFVDEIRAGAVQVSRDYSPYGRRRDRVVAASLARRGVAFRARRGVLIHEPEEVLTADGRPYGVFTPFLRRWESIRLRPVLPAPEQIPTVADRVALLSPAQGGGAVPDPGALGVHGPTGDVSRMPTTGEIAARQRLARWVDAGPDGGPTGYAMTRDKLADEGGTSGLGPDLRFGLVSPIEVATRALAADGGTVGSRRFVSELAWRDFYAHVLWHEPRVASEPFQHRYAGVDWPGGMLGDPSLDDVDGPVESWRTGMTGYPIVDAAMRQLSATGSMPNRARMIVASFLTKDLLVDWRVGEEHFMAHLLDGDPASNLGGWQWAASVGTDAQPYFRVFNPVTQAERFDPDGTFVRRWIPELARVPNDRIQAPWTMTIDEQIAAGCRIGSDYPTPIVDHAEARRRAIDWFASVRDGTDGT